MSEESDVIISCTECGATADYDTPCPNGCDPLSHYLTDEAQSLMEVKDHDALSSISLTEAIALVHKWIED